MKIIKINKDQITLEFSEKELGAIKGALEEVCNSIEAWEFDTRMAIGIDEAKKKLELLNLICKEMAQL